MASNLFRLFSFFLDVWALGMGIFVPVAIISLAISANRIANTLEKFEPEE